MDWNKRIRDLWIDFLFWIRFYIVSLMLNQRGLGYVASRILRNSTEFANEFVPLYGQENASRFEELLTRHILLLSELAATIRAGQSIEEQRGVWYANARDLAGFLASINPYWEETVWRTLLYNRYTLEESLLWKLQTGDFYGAIEQFDNAYFNAHQFADYMIDGITLQFQLPVLSQQGLQSAAPVAE